MESVAEILFLELIQNKKNVNYNRRNKIIMLNISSF